MNYPINFDKKYNILVSSVLGLGSTLFLIPLLKVLKLKFKNSRIKLLTWNHNTVFKGVDFIDDLLIIDDYYYDYYHIPNIDILFEVKIINKSFQIPLIEIKSKERYVINHYNIEKMRNDYIYFEFIKDLPINNISQKHLFYLYKKLNIREKFQVDALLFDEKKINYYTNQINDLRVAICLGNWSNKFGLINVDLYIKFIKDLVHIFPDIKILLIGKGSIERYRAKLILNDVKFKKNILNLVNMVTIKQLVQIFFKCKLVIGQDTGVIHLASSLDRNILLFTNNDNFTYPVSNKNNYIKIISVKNIEYKEILNDRNLWK